MPCDYRKYPNNWEQIRSDALVRARWACQMCGVDQYAVGYRNSRGRFVPNCGNSVCDLAGKGKHWPSLRQLTHAEAKEFCDHYNDHYGGKCDADGNHWFVIVLTIAHMDHNIRNNSRSNLKALCQRCHLSHDSSHHTSNARKTRDRKRGQADFVDAAALGQAGERAE